MPRDLAQKINLHQFRECECCCNFVYSGYLIRHSGGTCYTLFCCETCFQKKYHASCKVVFSFGDIDSFGRALADCCNLCLRLACRALLVAGVVAIVVFFLLVKPEIRPLNLPALHLPPAPLFRSTDAVEQQLVTVYDRFIQRLEVFP